MAGEKIKIFIVPIGEKSKDKFEAEVNQFLSQGGRKLVSLHQSPGYSQKLFQVNQNNYHGEYLVITIVYTEPDI